MSVLSKLRFLSALFFLFRFLKPPPDELSSEFCRSERVQTGQIPDLQYHRALRVYRPGALIFVRVVAGVLNQGSAGRFKSYSIPRRPSCASCPSWSGPCGWSASCCAGTCSGSGIGSQFTIATVIRKVSSRSQTTVLCSGRSRSTWCSPHRPSPWAACARSVRRPTVGSLSTVAWIPYTFGASSLEPRLKRPFRPMHSRLAV